MQSQVPVKYMCYVTLKYHSCGFLFFKLSYRFYINIGIYFDVEFVFLHLKSNHRSEIDFKAYYLNYISHLRDKPQQVVYNIFGQYCVLLFCIIYFITGQGQLIDYDEVGQNLDLHFILSIIQQFFRSRATSSIKGSLELTFILILWYSIFFVNICLPMGPRLQVGWKLTGI